MLTMLRPIVFQTFREARAAVEAIGADAGRVELMARKAVHRCVYVPEIRTRAAVILKQEMLAKGGEAVLPWSALCLATETTPVLLCGTLRQFENVCMTLRDQPFGLPELAEELAETLRRAAGEGALTHLRLGDERLPLGQRTYLMGIVNMTPDSFSGDGLSEAAERALAQAERMLEEGADLLDVGGESTRPGAEPVDEDEELRRVTPAISAILSRLPARVSVDTRHARVAREALAAGAVLVNDVTALTGDPDMLTACRDAHAAVCLMHMRQDPRTMQVHPEYDDVVSEVAEYLRGRVESCATAGIDREAILVDPGIGFGKTVEHNLDLLDRLHELRVATGMPVLAGPSRKSFIGEVLDLPVEDRLEGTAATVAGAIARGADMVRVHDVREMSRVCRMTDAIVRRTA